MTYIPIVRFNSMSNEEWSAICRQRYDELAGELIQQGYDMVKGESVYPFFFLNNNKKYYLARRLGSSEWYQNSVRNMFE